MSTIDLSFDSISARLRRVGQSAGWGILVIVIGFVLNYFFKGSTLVSPTYNLILFLICLVTGLIISIRVLSVRKKVRELDVTQLIFRMVILICATVGISVFASTAITGWMFLVNFIGQEQVINSDRYKVVYIENHAVEHWKFNKKELYATVRFISSTDTLEIKREFVSDGSAIRADSVEIQWRKGLINLPVVQSSRLFSASPEILPD